jgi:hypothetical protein
LVPFRINILEGYLFGTTESGEAVKIIQFLRTFLLLFLMCFCDSIERVLEKLRNFNREKDNPEIGREKKKHARKRGFLRLIRQITFEMRS